MLKIVSPGEYVEPTQEPETPAAVRVEQVTRTFGGRQVLAGLSLTIREREFVALLGASGSGKTTLLRILSGLDAPDAGEAWAPQARTVVFQEPRLVQSSRVWRNVVVGLNGARASRDRAAAALKEVGVAHLADAWPATLSGGEAQRVALARALVREPQLLLLDEPFAALDALTRLHMQRLVGDIRGRHGPAALLVTHDVDEALILADRVLVLRAGKIDFDRRITAAGPRKLAEPEFKALRRELLEKLGVAEAP